MVRKAIQVAAGGNEGEEIVVLCDDGTLWMGYFANSGFKWSKIPDVPQDDNLDR